MVDCHVIWLLLPTCQWYFCSYFSTQTTPRSQPIHPRWLFCDAIPSPIHIIQCLALIGTCGGNFGQVIAKDMPSSTSWRRLVVVCYCSYTPLNCKIDPPILLPSLLLYDITPSKVSQWLVVFKTPNWSWKWSTIASISRKFRRKERQFFYAALVTSVTPSPCHREHFWQANLFYLHFKRPVHASTMVEWPSAGHMDPFATMVGSIMVGSCVVWQSGCHYKFLRTEKIGEGRFFQQQHKINHDGEVWIDQINLMPPYQHRNWIVF